MLNHHKNKIKIKQKKQKKIKKYITNEKLLLEINGKYFDISLGKNIFLNFNISWQPEKDNAKCEKSK